jgi:CRISPR/Cas system CSM-associated protein Csm4 (group 5 of RAMP superfamily)
MYLIIVDTCYRSVLLYLLLTMLIPCDRSLKSTDENRFGLVASGGVRKNKQTPTLENQLEKKTP